MFHNLFQKKEKNQKNNLRIYKQKLEAILNICDNFTRLLYLHLHFITYILIHLLSVITQRINIIYLHLTYFRQFFNYAFMDTFNLIIQSQKYHYSIFLISLLSSILIYLSLLISLKIISMASLSLLCQIIQLVFIINFISHNYNYFQHYYLLINQIKLINQPNFLS